VHTESLPTFITRYFWGDNIKELDLVNHKKYIVQTLLERGDQQAITWLFSTIDRDTIQKLLKEIQLSKKSANFWHIYFS